MWKIFLDLDDTIFDFQLPLLKFWGAEIRHESEYPDGFYWDVRGAINYIRQHRYGIAPIRYTSQFWDLLPAQWWRDLQPYPGALDFVEWLETRPFLICIATACVTPGSACAKYDLIRKWLPEYEQYTFVGNSKYLLASTNSILVDDSDANCEAFEEAGGHSILVPRPWNKGYDRNTDVPVFEFVKDRIRQITT
jgi:FMN phosphatase YigB (HAD superfamily)